MIKNLQKALDNVNLTYEELNKIADDIILRSTKDINEYINKIVDIEKLDNEQLRQLIMGLALKTFHLGDAYSHALLKSEVAEALSKEKNAEVFNKSEGTVDVKKNTALLESSDEICVNMIYEIVSTALKIKSDECHRLIDAAKNVLISRQAEAKLSVNETTGEPGEKTRLLG